MANRPRSVEKWNALGSTYRARLERNGVTEVAYIRGDSLSAARGKANTPEHPKDFKPGKFPDYKPKLNRWKGGGAAARKRLEILAYANMDSKLKSRTFTRGEYKGGTARTAVLNPKEMVKPDDYYYDQVPDKYSDDQLLWIATANDEQLIAAGKSEPNDLGISHLYYK